MKTRAFPTWWPSSNIWRVKVFLDLNFLPLSLFSLRQSSLCYPVVSNEVRSTRESPLFSVKMFSFNRDITFCDDVLAPRRPKGNCAVQTCAFKHCACPSHYRVAHRSPSNLHWHGRCVLIGSQERWLKWNLTATGTRRQRDLQPLANNRVRSKRRKT